MQYRALALDLDGTTLVGEDLPDNNKRALQKAAAAGYEIIIATARWQQLAERIANEIGIRGLAIACSGAQVHDFVNGVDIFDHRLPADFVEAVYGICNKDRCIATVTVSDHVWLKLDGKPDMALAGEEMHWVQQLEVDPGNLPRIAAIQGTAVCQRIKDELGPRFAQSVSIFDSIGPTGKLVITITAKAANKGAALTAACAHLDVPLAQVVAFGDAENDLAMFALAGASVAMGQADERVKAAANFVSKPHDQDGVAHAVELLLVNGRLP